MHSTLESPISQLSLEITQKVRTYIHTCIYLDNRYIDRERERQKDLEIIQISRYALDHY